MNLSKKCLFTFLALSFLSLNGMEERQPEIKKCKSSKASLPKVKKTRQFIGEDGSIINENVELFSLSSICAFKIASLVKSGMITLEDLEEYLPEYCVKDIKSFNNAYRAADVYFDSSNAEPWIAKLISETKELFYDLIDSDSKYVEPFVAALDDFFKLQEDKGQPYPKCALSNIYAPGEPFLILKILLSMLRYLPNDQPNAQKILSTLLNEYDEVLWEIYRDEDIEYEIYGDLKKFIYHLAENSIDFNLFYSLNFILSLDKISRKKLLQLFYHALGDAECSRSILRALNDKISITKEEFEDNLDRILKDSLKNIELVNYVIELMRKFGLNVKEILNKPRTFKPKPFDQMKFGLPSPNFPTDPYFKIMMDQMAGKCSVTKDNIVLWLHVAILESDPEVVALLLEEGADPALMNPLGINALGLAKKLLLELAEEDARRVEYADRSLPFAWGSFFLPDRKAKKIRLNQIRKILKKALKNTSQNL